MLDQIAQCDRLVDKAGCLEVWKNLSCFGFAYSKSSDILVRQYLFSSKALSILSLPGQQKAENVNNTKALAASSGVKFIVIVDDERDIVDSLQRALQMNGFNNVVGFTDPQKALDFFAANHEHVCIVVTDVRMPSSMSGIDLASQIRSIDPRMKVLFTTAYEMYNDERLNNAMSNLGVAGCIKKPASMQQFCYLVESYYRSNL